MVSNFGRLKGAPLKLCVIRARVNRVTESVHTTKPTLSLMSFCRWIGILASLVRLSGLSVGALDWAVVFFLLWVLLLLFSFSNGRILPLLSFLSFNRLSWPASSGSFTDLSVYACLASRDLLHALEASNFVTRTTASVSRLNLNATARTNNVRVARLVEVHWVALGMLAACFGVTRLGSAWHNWLWHAFKVVFVVRVGFCLLRVVVLLWDLLVFLRRRIVMFGAVISDQRLRSKMINLTLRLLITLRHSDKLSRL